MACALFFRALTSLYVSVQKASARKHQAVDCYGLLTWY